MLLGLPNEEAAADALRRLVEAGLPVSEFAPAQSALEHTFLALREQEAHPTPASPPPPAPPVHPTSTEDGA